MRVLLVGPDREENLSIRYLSASLLAAGHEVELASFNSPLDAPLVIRALQGIELVGLSMCFQARAREFLELAREIRQSHPGILVVAGGHYASCAAEDLLRHHPELDLVGIHEGEKTLVDIADWLGRAGGPLSAIPGIAYRDGTRIRFSPPRPITEDLDSLPAPDRRGPVHLVAGVPTAYMFGSRGCLSSCDYCCICTLHTLAPGKRFRQRDPRMIAAEMRELYYGRGIRQFIFHDDNFLVPSETLNHRRLDAFQQALQETGIGEIGLYMKCRPGDATRAILHRLREMGLVRLFMGIESSTADGLASLGRRQGVEESEKALRYCDELGLSAQYTLLIFHPEATVQTIRSDLRFLREHSNHPLNFGRVELHAGTPLERRMLEAGRTHGNYLARSYDLPDPSANLACVLWRMIFRERCTGENGLLNSAILLNYLAAVMCRFYAGPRVRHLADDIEKWRLRVTATSLDLLGRLVDFCQSCPDPDNPRLPGFLRELRNEEDGSGRALLSQGDALHRRLDRLTLGMVGLEQSGGRMRRAAGLRGSVARHIAAVALGLQVGGVVPAFGCCDMEERVLDVDNDGLYDDLERQVFGTDPGKADSDGDKIADSLEDHDADGIRNLDEQTDIGRLGQAADAGDIQAVRSLIRDGVELDATEPNWQLTALARAAGAGELEAIRTLLGAGADVNAPAFATGVTALIAAAGNNRQEAVRLLLKAGADVRAKSSYGQTALKLAESNGYLEIAALLKQAGAEE